MAGGQLLILSAPSGAGKTTLAHRLLRAYPDRAVFSVSYTTRAPRGQEQDGVDYHFVDRAAFQAMVERDELVEWAQVHGQWYGSHRRYVDEAARGRLVIFDIDVQGGETLKARFPEAISVFVLPPSMQELARRLRQRATDSDEVVQRRLLAAQAEMARGCASYDYLVVNEDLDEAFEDLKAILRAEGCRRGRTSLEGRGFEQLLGSKNTL